jgi:hypothetical protein
MNSRTRERCAERLLAEPGLQHDEAQTALAATSALHPRTRRSVPSACCVRSRSAPAEFAVCRAWDDKPQTDLAALSAGVEAFAVGVEQLRR